MQNLPIKAPGVITRNDMMALILDACPSFVPTWKAFLDEWREEVDALPYYLVLADLARHMIGMLERGEKDQLARLFQVVERLHLEGDGFVREAATIGLLEDLQNLNLHSKTCPEQFVPFLGTESAIWWDKLNQFWSGSS